jgi:hypothetical protein
MKQFKARRIERSLRYKDIGLCRYTPNLGTKGHRLLPIKAPVKLDTKRNPFQFAIEELLNWNDTSACFLVEWVILVLALLGYQEFTQRGLNYRFCF